MADFYKYPVKKPRTIDILEIQDCIEIILQDLFRYGVPDKVVSRRRFEPSTIFAINSTQYFVKMLRNTARIPCAFSLSCFEFIAKISLNSPPVKKFIFLVRKAKMG